MILSDLGQSITLSDFLLSSNQTRHLLVDAPEGLLPFCQRLGSTLGNFFAELHSPRTLNIIGPERILRFHNPDQREFVLQEAIAPVEGILQTYGIPDPAELCRRIKEDFLRESSEEEKAFVLGDLWPGGILLGEEEMEKQSPGVIDWEFAGWGRGVNGDMAQLLANLHLLLMASPARSALRTAIEGLIRSLNESYRARAQSNGSTFVIPSTEDLQSSGDIPLPPSAPTARILRSAFLEHGREIVSMAVLRDWQCLCCRVQVKETCPLIKSMVERGAWYLQRAGTNSTEFVEERNWQLVCEEEGKTVQGLFMSA